MSSQQSSSEASSPPPDELSEAFDHFVSQLRSAEAEIRGFGAYTGDEPRARGYQHLARMLLKSLEHELLQDPAHPQFRVLDDRIREGGDNPDQRYVFAKIDGGEPYRVWGNRGSAARLEMQLYSEEPFGGKNVSVGYLPHELIDFADDGSFSIDLSATAEGRSALVNPPEATIVQVRQIYDRWTDEDAGTVHLDRVGWEGHRKTAESAAQVAERLRLAADNLLESTRCWPRLVEDWVVNSMEVNTLPPLMTPGERAGVVGRWISLGHFSLEPQTALVITASPVGADYQGIQLSDLWFASLEYGNATGSISGAHAEVGPDGRYRYVVAADDPGYVNWLDTGGLTQGTVHLRFDGVDGEIPQDLWPSAQVVPLDELATAIPGFADQCIDADARDAQRSLRRRHVQARYGR